MLLCYSALCTCWPCGHCGGAGAAQGPACEVPVLCRVHLPELFCLIVPPGDASRTAVLQEVLHLLCKQAVLLCVFLPLYYLGVTAHL